MRSRGIVLTIAIIVACWSRWAWRVISSSTGPGFPPSVFSGVFWTIIGAKVALFSAVFVATGDCCLGERSACIPVRGLAAYLCAVNTPWESLGSKNCRR